jgi:hypothetical protein
MKTKVTQSYLSHFVQTFLFQRSVHVLSHRPPVCQSLNQFQRKFERKTLAISTDRNRAEAARPRFRSLFQFSATLSLPNAGDRMIAAVSR